MDGSTMELPMDRAGEKLRRAREAAGLTLKDVASRTRITERHLQMIEDSNYTELPGRPYALGFAKNYARAVGLDGETVAHEVRDELNRESYPLIRRPSYQMELEDPAKVPSRGLTILAALVLVVGLVAVGAFFGRNYFMPAADLPAISEKDDPLLESAALAPSPTAESAAPTPAVAPGAAGSLAPAGQPAVPAATAPAAQVPPSTPAASTASPGAVGAVTPTGAQ